MPEETKHGTPKTPDENQDGHGSPLECAEFEALLSDAMDGAELSPSRMNMNHEGFEAHRRSCAVCGPLFADVHAGRQWLRSLDAVEPPAYMVHNILAATSGVISTRTLAATPDGRTTPFGERLRERWDSFFAPLSAFVRQPRFVMSFGMIFFSFSLGLSVAGVKPKDVAKVDLRPSALRHAYNDAQLKVVKYYDNIRFVYEIESTLRELKRTNTPAEPTPVYPKEEQKENRKNDTSGQPDQRQDRNYSQDYNQPVLAALRDGVGKVPPAVTATTNRRFV